MASPVFEWAARDWNRGLSSDRGCFAVRDQSAPVPALESRCAALARIHRRDAVLALTRGLMGTGRRTGQARSR